MSVSYDRRGCAARPYETILRFMPVFRRAFRPLGFALLISAGLTACDRNTTSEPAPPPASGRIASLATTPASQFLQVGQQQAIALEARDSGGVLIASPVVTWRTDAPAVVTVDAAGNIRAIAPGSARITVTSGALSALVQIGVTAVFPGVQQWRVARAGLTDNTLLGIWDDGQGTTYGVGQNGLLMKSQNEGVWDLVSVNSVETLVGIWGSAPNDIWIVGTNGLILHGDGTTFLPVVSGTTATLLEVWGLSATEIYAAGDRGTILRWDGTRWTSQSTPVIDDLWGIWGANSSALFVVGNNGVVLRYDGQVWRRMSVPTANALFDVWGTSAGNVFTVGTSGAILRFDGVAWTPMTTPGAANLFAMRGRAFNDIYAVGNTGASYHFDGVVWRAMDIGTGQNLRAITTRGDGSLRIGAWWGTVVTVRGTGATAVGTTEVSDPALLSVYSAPTGPTFAVGLGGAVFRRDGSSWRPEPVAGTNDLYGISGSGANDIIAVGDTGSILRFNGATWRRETSPTTRLLRAVWNGGSGQSVIVGERGTILRASGGPFAPQASGTSQFLRAVWGSDPANVYVVGDSGVVLHFDGGRWNRPCSAPRIEHERTSQGTREARLRCVAELHQSPCSTG